jgi:hypothetical protein
MADSVERLFREWQQWYRTIKADFGACEIKTVRVPRDAGQTGVETSLLEWTEE